MIRNLTISATLMALAVAMGFALAQVPNVELITLVVFSSGYLLGARRGWYIGLCSMGLFTVFNPLGAPAVPVALAQVLAMSICGFVGGKSRRWLHGLIWAKLALLGLGCTLFYDLTTNAAMALSFGLFSRLFSILLAGLVFSFLHVVSNMIFFAVAGPFLIRLRPVLQPD